MDYPEFRKLVKEMRTAQRRYFKTRSYEWMKKSLDLEQKVDKELENPKLL